MASSVKIPTTTQIIVRIGATIALVELAIMLALVYVPAGLSAYNEAILDAALLIVFSTPIIYAWVIKPYLSAHENLICQIKHMANHDSLTQLANRRFLSEYFEEKFPDFSNKKLYGAVLFIDLDGFKIINDQHGHDAGDEILVKVARRLHSFIRTEDIVSRVGGDEFVMILHQLDIDKSAAQIKALRTAKRIQQSLNRIIKYKALSLQVGSSIGIRILTAQQTNIDAVLKDADSAMYHAKQAGNGSIVVFQCDDCPTPS